MLTISAMARGQLFQRECLHTGLRATEDERVNVMRTFVCVDRLKVHHMANYMVFIADSIAAVHVARRARLHDGA